MKLMWQTKLKHIIGTPDQNSWAQVHHFVPQKEDKLSKRGELVLLVSLKDLQSSQEPAVLGREVISRFHEEYYGKTEQRPMKALKNVLAKVGQEEPKFFPSPEQLSLVALVFWQDLVYLAVWDNGEIRLRRDMETKTILEGEADNHIVVSGQVKENDLYMLATTDFIDQVPAEMLTASLSTEDLETIGEILTPVVHAQKRQGQLASVFVKLTGKKKESVQTITQSSLEKEEALEDQEKKPSLKKKIKLPSFNFKKLIFSKTAALIMAIVLFGALSVSVYLGWQRRQKQKKQEKIQQLSSQIEERVKVAQQIRNLDPENSLKAASEAEPIIDELAQLDDQKADQWTNTLKSIKSGLGEKRIRPEVYYDLSLVADDINVKGVYAVDGQAWIIDDKGPRLISINLAEKKAEIIAGGQELKNQNYLVSTRTRQYLISDQEISLLQGDELESVKELDKDVTAASGWIGSLYLFDKQEGQIWKYPSITGGIGDGRQWLNNNFDTDEEVVDMAIDSNIWVLMSDGYFYKYLSGARQNLELDLPSGIGKASLLALSQEEEKLAFWDEGNKIVWLFDKQGEFQSRLPLDLDQVKGISFSSQADALYLFANNKVYLLDNLSF